MVIPPPPQRLCRSQAELMDDLILEILLHIPPYKPSHLIRCSAVCKNWRRLLTDPAFLRRYREFHGVPPMLGFLFNMKRPGHLLGARYARTTAFRPRTLDHKDISAIDSRHGRVLLCVPQDGHISDKDILVWDPVTDERWHLPAPAVQIECWVATVLCAATLPASGRECDHLDCHGGHFLVAVVGTTAENEVTRACVYSSEAAAWGNATFAEEIPGNIFDYMDMRPTALVGNTIYFFTSKSRAILEYDLGRQRLALIDTPLMPDPRGDGVLMPARGRDGILMPAPGGGLGLAAMHETCLHLFSRETGPDGIMEWKQRRVIELNTIGVPRLEVRPYVVGFAEGLDAIFVVTNVGVFAIELKSGRVKKVSNRTDIDLVIPFMSFYTPDHATQLQDDDHNHGNAGIHP